jgi:hypothetical protein
VSGNDNSGADSIEKAIRSTNRMFNASVQAVDRVTRLGEFSTIRRIWAFFPKKKNRNSSIFWLFSLGKSYVLILAGKARYILGNFLQTHLVPLVVGTYLRAWNFFGPGKSPSAKITKSTLSLRKLSKWIIMESFNSLIEGRVDTRVRIRAAAFFNHVRTP